MRTPSQYIFTVRNSSCGEVMFSQISIQNSVGGGGGWGLSASRSRGVSASGSGGVSTSGSGRGWSTPRKTPPMQTPPRQTLLPTPAPGRHSSPPPPQADTPPHPHPRQTLPETATAVGGTHPTAIHFCFYRFHAIFGKNDAK